MGRLNSAQRLWKDVIDNPASTADEQKQAALELEKIARRHARSKVRARYKKSSSVDDPKPLRYPPYDSVSESEYRTALSVWERRHPKEKSNAEVSKPVEKVPKPKAEFVAWTEPELFSPPAPAPAPPAPATFGHPSLTRNRLYEEMEQGRLRKIENDSRLARLAAEEAVRVVPALMTPEERIAAEQAERSRRTHIELDKAKAKAGAPPDYRERSELYATGQIQTVDEARAPFKPTAQNGDGGRSIEPDKRGWLPNARHD